MKFFLITLFSFFSIFANEYIPRDGDIIFQETNSPQGRALKIATKSRYTHVGIIFQYDGEWKVLEANGPVQKTNLKKFISRGIGGHYLIKRLKDADTLLDPSSIEKLKQTGEAYLGKPYDLLFRWEDNRIYCSELVWKMYYKSLNIEVGKLKTISQFDTSNLFVKFMVWKRNLNHGDKMIAPSEMEKSDLLVKVR